MASKGSPKSSKSDGKDKKKSSKKSVAKPKNQKNTKPRNQQKSSMSSTMNILIVFIIVALVLIIYIISKIPPTPEPKTTTPITQKPIEEGHEAISRFDCLPVYFYDANAQYFVPVHLPIKDKSSPLNERVEDIIKVILIGPPTDGLLGVMPSGTKLNSVITEGDLVTVDLSKEIIAYGGGTTQETGIVQSLLLSLTSLPQIKRVQILVDGSSVETMPEGTEIGKPLERLYGPNSNFPFEGKTAEYIYYLDPNKKFLVPVLWSWETDTKDPIEKLKALYSAPNPNIYFGLHSPAPAGINIIKCEIENNKLNLQISHPDFANIFTSRSAETFLKATYLSLHTVKQFKEVDILVGDGDDAIDIYTFAPFEKLRTLQIPPLCYNEL